MRAIDLLMSLAKAAHCFQSPDGRFQVRVTPGGCDEILEVRSDAFRDWLLDAYLKEFPGAFRRAGLSTACWLHLKRRSVRMEKPTVHVRALIVVSAALGLGSSVQCRRAVRLAASRTGSVLQRGLDLCV